jgi:hypothetical protein
MTAPRRFTLAAVSAALTALALAGCGPQPGGNQAGGGPAGGTATTPATTAPTTTTPPTTTPPATTPTGKSGSGTTVTVEGVIEPGVEHGCYVLTPTSGGQKYLVLGQTKPPTDVRVRVHGTTQPDTMSYCQQGTPLQVSTIERL